MRPHIDISHALGDQVTDYAEPNELNLSEAYIEMLEAGIRLNCVCVWVRRDAVLRVLATDKDARPHCHEWLSRRKYRLRERFVSSHCCLKERVNSSLVRCEHR
jgi:hypothetical protein